MNSAKFITTPKNGNIAFCNGFSYRIEKGKKDDEKKNLEMSKVKKKKF